MWTSQNRGSYDRGKLRYPSDVTDDDWAHIAPLFPPGEDHDRAAQDRDTLAELMTPAQIAEAEKLTREWRPRAQQAQ